MYAIARRLLVAGLILTVLSAMTACDDDPMTPAPGGGASSLLQTMLDSTASQHQIPGLAAAIVEHGRTQWAATGVRRLDAVQPLQPGDLLYLGSNAKAIAATVIGMLVEEGLLAWEDRAVDVFPELASTMHAQYLGVTLEQLLSHRSGAPGMETIEEMLAVPPMPGDGRRQREAFTAWLLAQPPAGVPGEYRYSNAGYAVAAAMAERRAGRDWQWLVDDLLCAPLRMQPAFGWPGSGGASQPWGHVWDGAALVPFDPDGPVQPPDFVIPAGHLSLTLEDYAAFLRLHLQGLRGRQGLLRASTIQKLHTPIGSYALGWERVEAGGEVFSIHVGSDDTFTCLALVAPARDLALAVVANAAHAGTEQGLLEVMTWALQQAGLRTLEAGDLARETVGRASCVAK